MILKVTHIAKNGEIFILKMPSIKIVDLAKKMRTFATTRSDLDTVANGIDKQRTIAFSLVKKTRFKK